LTILDTLGRGEDLPGGRNKARADAAWAHC
jgi:hypothetical protein